VPTCSVALFHLDEYETALDAFQHGQALAPDMAAFKTWVRKCQAAIEGERCAWRTSAMQGWLSFTSG
jgi:hypothetical protein